MEEKKKDILILSNGKKVNRKNWIVAGLRRMSYRWPFRSEAFKKARVERGLYKCAMCEGTFRNREINLDHIIPVVSVKDGFTNWDEFIYRLFCTEDGFQVICINCHDSKTLVEDKMRDSYGSKRKKKLAKKKKE